MVATGIDVGKANLGAPILDGGPECRFVTAKPGPRGLHIGLVRYGVGCAVSAATRSDHWQLQKRLTPYPAVYDFGRALFDADSGAHRGTCRPH